MAGHVPKTYQTGSQIISSSAEWPDSVESHPFEYLTLRQQFLQVVWMS
jgi:hypothetical protein